MKKRWILCTVAVLCIAAVLLGCGKKNVGTPEDNAVVEEDDKKMIIQGKVADCLDLVGLICRILFMTH